MGPHREGCDRRVPVLGGDSPAEGNAAAGPLRRAIRQLAEPHPGRIPRRHAGVRSCAAVREAAGGSGVHGPIDRRSAGRHDEGPRWHLDQLDRRARARAAARCRTDMGRGDRPVRWHEHGRVAPARLAGHLLEGRGRRADELAQVRRHHQRADVLRLQAARRVQLSAGQQQRHLPARPLRGADPGRCGTGD